MFVSFLTGTNRAGIFIYILSKMASSVVTLLLFMSKFVIRIYNLFVRIFRVTKQHLIVK
jgi:hypothetical protein